MSDQYSSTINQPTESPTPAIKLWTPRAVGMTSFFLGFPGGIVLASINWIRMGLKDKAILHLIGGAIGTFVFTLILFFTPSTWGRGLGLVVNLGVLFYLHTQTKKDIEIFQTNNTVQNASGWGGCLIGLGILVLFLALVFVMGFIFAMLGFQFPE